MEPRISLITLGVNDLTQSIRFYQQLGLPRYDFDSDEVAFFDLQGSWLGLYPKRALGEDAGVEFGKAQQSPFTLAHNLSSREAVDQVMAEAMSAGATLVKPAQQTFWGGYSGYFSDPDGFLWELAHVPHFWIGPEENKTL
ncbi:MAG: VOC family protein [Candidatus Thiodiazotropha lotti]|nr:VOC family protein [Candidatus Thiodiazotropha lotti]MCG7932496.1 VOC family protein [Candidatus Thiodiazotropha lotti]MCW4222347.1 VOC family protein [Candidatus Thiodiazotropha lotti]ODC00022.1 glyoxalase [Candidatus Thiodiazotropha endoloripes]